jgi:uncharacterized protein YecE (DUF72 family)
MIRVGIGGWTYEPWRGTFYPPGLPQARELEYASRQLTSIEINGTFYRTQTRASFRKWADETPDGFVFALKGPRFATNRRILAEAGPSIERFLESGVTELGSKLGPLLWQFAPTKKFDAQDFAAFLALLPKQADGRALQHVVEVRHATFRSEAFIALVRGSGIAVVFSDAEKYPSMADVTAPFVYARLQKSRETEPTGYAPAELEGWAKRLRTWAAGGEPDDLPRTTGTAGHGGPRPVFAYMIDGAKERAPAAAMALIERLGG